MITNEYLNILTVWTNWLQNQFLQFDI